VAIGKAIEAELGDRRGTNQYTEKEDCQNFGEAISGKRKDDIAAEQAGFGNKETYRQAKKVVESGIPEIIEKMDNGEIAVSVAAVAITSCSGPADCFLFGIQSIP